jgi:hypothetical protein
MNRRSRIIYPLNKIRSAPSIVGSDIVGREQRIDVDGG